MRQDAQKSARIFCARKTAKKRKTHPEKPEKGKTGCVLGAGEGSSGWRRILLLEKCTTMAWWWPQQQKDLPAFLAKRCWLELPLKGAPSRRSSLKTCHRHVFLTLGPSRVQVLPRSNEKSQASQKRYLTFLAGAEGLEPSARGFGVDVGKHTRERGKGRCHPILAASHKTGGAGLVLRPQKEGRGRLIPATSRFCTPPPRPAWRPGWA